MRFDSYDEMASAFWALYRSEAWEDALDLLTPEADAFPDHASQVLYLRSCVAARAGRPEAAVRILAEAVERGHWYGEGLMRASPSWKSLQGRPDFERLVDTCRRREAAAQAAAVPRLLLETPDDGRIGRPAPVLVAVHGNGDNAEAALAGWRPIVSRGWAVAALQSSQVAGSGQFGWFDQELAVREIEQLIATLRERSAIDANRMVIAAFHLGGEPALRVALRRQVPVSGFVLIDPFGPATPAAPDWLPLVGPQREAGLRGCILLAERPLHLSHDLPRSIAAVLSSNGVPCGVHQVSGLGYGYPPDVWSAFSLALAFIETRP